MTGDPGFVNPVLNGPRDPTLSIPEFTTLQTAGAFDEGGNFIQVTYGPLTLDELTLDGTTTTSSLAPRLRTGQEWFRGR